MGSHRTRIRKDVVAATRLLERIDREVAVFIEHPRPDIVGVAEAAEILGIEPTSIGARRRRGVMPEPLADLKCGPIWLKEDIEALA